MKTLTTDLRFDPWAGCPLSHTENEGADSAPLNWERLSDGTRQAIGGACVLQLREHPHAQRGDVHGLAHKVWETLDVEARDELQNTIGNFLGLLRNALLKLLQAGSVLATLYARRAALDKQIETLERLTATDCQGHGRQ